MPTEAVPCNGCAGLDPHHHLRPRPHRRLQTHQLFRADGLEIILLQ